MDNYVDELNARIEKLYDRIYQNKNMLVAYNLIEKEHSNYQHIFMLPEIINRNMQVGNYRRAALYSIFTERMMDEIESNSGRIREKINDYILTD
ncbi:hypothetical protein [Butyrivibrio sp. LC3010]|uniref:hypothetical protein n=1 Tax=Butyrivibrio sp. LC3010 TaxID=1280680 RepID=UPI00041A357E|nr:hypothetical protein [Butyrivibrio sp. LC3010]